MSKPVIIFMVLICLLAFTTASSFAMTTTQKALILNLNKNEAFDQLEEFSIINGFAIQYSDPFKGLMQIFVRETVDDGTVNASSNSFFYNPPKTTRWYFSVKINQQSNNALILGSSTGGLMPGRYFKKYVQYMQNKGYTVLTDEKEIKNALANTTTMQPVPVQTIQPVNPQNNFYPQGYPQQISPYQQGIQGQQYPYYGNYPSRPGIVGVPKNYSNNPRDPAYRFNYNF